MESRLSQMQARFQQKQMQEKEEKLLKLYENQQQRAFDRVGRGSAGSDGSLSKTITGNGKVRQLFEERRQKAGIDRSYPLEPLRNNKPNNVPRGKSMDRIRNNNTTVKSTRTTTQSNGRNPVVIQKREITKLYNNNNNAEDDAENFLKQHDIVALMNNHNLSDSLDDESMPHIGFDDFDETIFTSKLSNVGGKLPSQNVVAKKVEAQPKIISNGTARGSPLKQRETKVGVKSVVKVEKSAPPSPSFASVKSLPGSLEKSSTMSGKAPTPPAKANNPSARSAKNSPSGEKSSAMSGKSPTPSAKASVPSANRPSAKNSPRQGGPGAAVKRDDLAACRYCERRFASDRIATHEDICARTGKKKRKTYDATKHRLVGTELEPYARKTTGKGSGAKKTKQSASNSNWRQQHEEFISAIRAAKQVQQHIAKGGKLSDLPPPPPSSNPDYVQCPHCGRRFNETAAQRHIPKCASYDYNKPKPGAKPTNSSKR